MDLSFLESDPNLPPPAYTDIMFPREEAEQQRSGSVPTESGSLLQNNRIWIQRCRLYLRSLVRRRRGVLTPGSAERGNSRDDLVSDNPSTTTTTSPPTAFTPAWGAAKAFVDECKAWGEGLEGRLHDAVHSEALAKREAAEAREEAAAAREREKTVREREKAAREREKAVREREKMVREREKAAREREKAAREREKAAREREKTAREREKMVREREKAAREREKAARERAEAANRGREEALSQLRAEMDESIKQRKLWFNRELELVGRILDLEFIANSQSPQYAQ